MALPEFSKNMFSDGSKKFAFFVFREGSELILWDSLHQVYNYQPDAGQASSLRQLYFQHFTRSLPS